MRRPSAPLRGTIWLADLGRTRGHEQAGSRPILIVSADIHNLSRAEMVIALPLTKTVRRHPYRVLVRPPEGNLRVAGDILCDQIRAISHDRLIRSLGAVAPATLTTVELALRALLEA